MYILATDYDGTLSRGGVSQRNKDAIRRFREAGNLFGVVTGRDYYMYNTLVDNGTEFDFILPFNGGMTINTNGIVTADYRAPNDENIIYEIAEMMRDYDSWLGCSVYKTHYTFHPHHPNGGRSCLPMEYSFAIPSFSMLNTGCTTSERAAECAARVNERFGHIVTALQNGSAVDFPPRGIDKGEGVARYAAAMGVPTENIYCAGDEMNDIAMISRFHGCAVENARQEIKDAAEHTYADIAEIIDTILSK
ncbi:MAG: HAD family phosphatase [Clostridia bacterium]|nr:HAD family phosphatase [Clostridia bacterium]MBQ8332558.1 HAD family phosphatase [Clostridia bacterium]MBQ8513482.1 HAD family phosphatase [Clostridia bacterium]